MGVECAAMRLGLCNAWLLCAPLLLAGVVMTVVRPGLARRMADMSGYSARERAVTVAASLLPYPFMVLSAWMPLGAWPILAPGLLVWVLGMAGFAWSIAAALRTPPDRPFAGGPYRLSRNPIYVSSTCVFAGVCLASASAILAALLALILVLQHGMILAEERWCRARYGVEYQAYLGATRRYL
jgi:protein-S-isoprenylcysteine O-methyltransferase Ste14